MRSSVNSSRWWMCRSLRQRLECGRRRASRRRSRSSAQAQRQVVRRRQQRRQDDEYRRPRLSRGGVSRRLESAAAVLRRGQQRRVRQRTAKTVPAVQHARSRPACRTTATRIARDAKESGFVGLQHSSCIWIAYMAQLDDAAATDAYRNYLEGFARAAATPAGRRTCACAICRIGSITSMWCRAIPRFHC